MWFLFCLRKREMIMENNFFKKIDKEKVFFFFLMKCSVKLHLVQAKRFYVKHLRPYGWIGKLS